jgi:hypothetical protein
MQLFILRIHINKQKNLDMFKGANFFCYTAAVFWIDYILLLFYALF